MIPAQLGTGGALPPLHRRRVGLRPVVPQETVPHAVIAVRLEVRGEVVKGPRLVKEIVFDDAVLVARPGGVKAHLQVLVVDFDMVEGELQVRKHAEVALARAGVLDPHIPQLGIVVDRDENGLLRVQVLVVAGELRVRETVPALVAGFRQVLAHGLPGDRPILARVVIAQVDVAPRPVQRNAVGAEARNPLVLGILVEGVPAGVVRDHGA